MLDLKITINTCASFSIHLEKLGLFCGMMGFFSSRRNRQNSWGSSVAIGEGIAGNVTFAMINRHKASLFNYA